MLISRIILSALLTSKLSSSPACHYIENLEPLPPTPVGSMLKPIESNDLNEINDLFVSSKKHWGYKKDVLKTFFDKYLLKPTDLEMPSYAVWEKNKPIGFMTTLIQDDELWLDNLFIHPNYFRKGLGTYLFNVAVAVAKENGYSSFKLISDPNANIFYEKKGCKFVGSVPSSYNEMVNQNIYEFNIPAE